MESARCPRCDSRIEQNQFLQTMVLCKCGWSTPLKGAKTQADVDRGTSFSLLFYLLILFAGIYHYVTWDVYSLEIIIPKIKQISKTATSSDFILIAKICEKRFKSKCQMKALEEAVDLGVENLNVYSLLADKYQKKGLDEEALELYESYFSKGGGSLESMLSYAELTGEIGDVTTSHYYFRKALDSKPNLFQPKITRSFVEMLLKNQHYKKANDAILYYRTKDKNARYFMEKELTEINRDLASNKLSSK